jgi:predicted nuclease with RNAse H fold
MNLQEKIWVGADPGGKRKFGLAILRADGSVDTWCVNCADDAVDRVGGIEPAGIGVDAPLWWSSAGSSDRKADRWLRESYGLAGGKVQTGNSLRGAALIQGAMFVQRMREKFPGVPVTETHPKAVMKTESWVALAERLGLKAKLEEMLEHERDATISALAAREGFEKRWTNDLSTERDPREQDPSSYWLAPVHYFWPESLGRPPFQRVENLLQKQRVPKQRSPRLNNAPD